MNGLKYRFTYPHYGNFTLTPIFLLDGKLLLASNTSEAAAEVVQRYKSLADIERVFRVLKSDIEIGPVYHRLPHSAFAPMR